MHRNCGPASMPGARFSKAGEHSTAVGASRGMKYASPGRIVIVARSVQSESTRLHAALIGSGDGGAQQSTACAAHATFPSLWIKEEYASTYFEFHHKQKNDAPLWAAEIVAAPPLALGIWRPRRDWNIWIHTCEGGLTGIWDSSRSSPFGSRCVRTGHNRI